MTHTVYLGWDSRETLAYEVAESSILRRASGLVRIEPLKLGSLPMLTRPTERRDGKLWCPISQAPMSTEFAISRFCVPFLQRQGWALFADCDIVCLGDIAELFSLADERYAVQVVRHDHMPAETTKMDGQIQTAYSRKNWSSVCLWNCEHPANERLSLRRLNEWPGRDLHAFKWLQDHEIGVLPAGWNHLVGVSKETTEIKLLHYTRGGPWLPGWKGGPLDEAWLEEKEHACVGV